MNNLYHLWYSKKAINYRGLYVFSTQNNKKMIGNFLTSKKDSSIFSWTDLIYMGEVFLHGRETLIPMGLRPGEEIINKTLDNISKKYVVPQYHHPTECKYTTECNHPAHARYALRNGGQGCYKCGNEELRQ